jgi:hypothetical protein
MRFSSWAIIKALLMVLIFIALVIIFIPRNRPCEELLTYRIGKVDKRFGLSEQEVSEAAVTAASLWGKAVSRELFQESPTGAIEINFVYDYRQEATDKLKLLNYNIDNTKSSYDDLKARFENQKKEYDQRSTSLSNDLNSYNDRVAAFNREAATLPQGGFPKQVYERLMTEKNELQSMQNYLQVQQDEIKRLADTINNLVVVLNEIAANLNLDSVNYRNTVEPLVNEFNEGTYVTEKGKETITIYQFNDRNRLIRVLTHEFGHALGLKHSDKPEAVMYRMNQSDSIELNQADITLLQTRCEDK